MLLGRTAPFVARASGERLDKARTRPLGESLDMSSLAVLPLTTEPPPPPALAPAPPPNESRCFPRRRCLPSLSGVKLKRPLMAASWSPRGVDGAAPEDCERAAEGGSAFALPFQANRLEGAAAASRAAFSSGSSSIEDSREHAHSESPAFILTTAFPLRAFIITGMVPQRTRLMRPCVEPRRTSSISSLLNSSMASAYWRCCS
mmetsp:Transcript_53064/g.137041  ORF Transcript_53064/g.137041 Transcript_53064/m.137041 type:complete len:203 (-) Transcript_53064:398-1006(-)